MISRDNISDIIKLENIAVITATVAGYGKSTTIAHWKEILDSENKCNGLVNLDQDDNDPVRFFSHIINSLKYNIEEMYISEGDNSQSNNIATTKTYIASLIHEFSLWPDPIVLFIDDYQLITDQEIHDNFNWLIRHLPKSIMYVIASRFDIPFSLNSLKLSEALSVVVNYFRTVN